MIPNLELNRVVDQKEKNTSPQIYFVGWNRCHHHDVCRTDKRVHREEGTAGLDQFRYTCCVLLFHGCDADQQCDDFSGG